MGDTDSTGRFQFLGQFRGRVLLVEGNNVTGYGMVIQSLTILMTEYVAGDTLVDYITLINEVMCPVLLISDILIILPVLIKERNHFVEG